MAISEAALHDNLLTPVTNFKVVGDAMNFPLNSNTVLSTEEVRTVLRQFFSTIIALNVFDICMRYVYKYIYPVNVISCYNYSYMYSYTIVAGSVTVDVCFSPDIKVDLVRTSRTGCISFSLGHVLHCMLHKSNTIKGK